MELDVEDLLWKWHIKIYIYIYTVNILEYVELEYVIARNTCVMEYQGTLRLWNWNRSILEYLEHGLGQMPNSKVI